MQQTNATPHGGEDTLRTRYGLAVHGTRQGRVLQGRGYGHRPFLASTPASSTNRGHTRWLTLRVGGKRTFKTTRFLALVTAYGRPRRPKGLRDLNYD